MIFLVMKEKRKHKNLVLITTRFHLNFAASLLVSIYKLKWISVMLDSFVAYDKNYYQKMGSPFVLPFRALSFMESLSYKKSDVIFISSAYEISELNNKVRTDLHAKIERTPLSTKMINCDSDTYAKSRSRIISQLGLDVDTYIVTFHGNFKENVPSLQAARFLIETLSWKLYNINKKICILLIGKGLEGYDLSRYKNIRYLGFVDNLCEYLSNTCLEVVPIVGGQGIKMKILDAMALGKAVIASEDGERGFVEPNPIIVERMDKFAERINELVTDKDKLAEIGKKSREYVIDYYSDTSMFRTVVESLVGSS